MKNSSACKDFLIEAMKYHLLPADQRALMKTARTRMRTPACYPKVMPSLLRHLLRQGWPTLVHESRCPACFRCFPAPAHLIQMNGHYPASTELGNNPFI